VQFSPDLRSRLGRVLSAISRAWGPYGALRATDRAQAQGDFIDVDGPWIVAGASWWDGRSWHDSGSAPCLDNGNPIELGIIEAAQYKDAPGRGVVV
jgi:hypothetical protein